MLMVDYDYVEKPGSQGNYGENTALLSVCSPCPMISVKSNNLFLRAATAPTSASTTAGPSYYPGRGPRTMAFLVGRLARTGLSFRIRRVEAFTCKEAAVKSPPDARAHETPGPPCRELAHPSLLPRRPHKGRRRIPREPLRVKNFKLTDN